MLHMPAGKQQTGGIGSGKTDHVVIIFKENHTFDNYFGTFPGVNGMNMPRSPNPPPLDPGDLSRISSSLPLLLDQSNMTWGNYGGYAFQYLSNVGSRNKFTSDQFAKDAASGRLPNVSWVYATSQFDEHPPDRGKGSMGNVTTGMQWTVDQVNAIVRGGLWG